MHNRLGAKAHRKCLEPGHCIHKDFWMARIEYTKLIKSTKLAHWNKFIESANDATMWAIHNYMTRSPTDGGRTKVPTLYVTNP